MELSYFPNHGGAEFDALVEAGARSAARFIPPGARVLDFGGSGTKLERHLPEGCTRVAREFETPAPSTNAYDFVVALVPFTDQGEALALLKTLRALDKPVVVGLPPPRGSSGAGPKVSREMLLGLVVAAGFARARIGEGDGDGAAVARLEPAAPVYRAERQVWVLSYSNVGNFGDRLGQHLLSQVLPPNARVVRLHHNPWNAPPEGEPDLLIVGLGNSLFQPLLTDDLISLLGRAKSAVGIFGTQYRDAIDRRRLDAVLDRLHMWWARYEADQYFYGNGRSNVRHLGDWLIDAFPLARPMRKDLLTVGQEIWEDLPLDRTIQRIQAHSRVLSTRLHPLLCALTSAEEVAYREQRESSTPNASGKFRSMLVDVFGEAHPEGEFWRVDPSAVAGYKTKVRANIDQLREELARLIA